jgi:hypothetical protein
MPVLFLALKSGRIWYEPGFEEHGGAPGREMEIWPALLWSIQEERCTPILGPGLVESLVGSRQEIAMRWASVYRQQHGDYLPEDIYKSLEALLLAEGRRRREHDPAEPHKVLAELPFKIYVTAGQSNLLGDALVDAGKKPDIELCRWNNDIELPPPIYEMEPDYRPSTERPYVYHVFGHLSNPDSLVLTEDDYFEYFTGVTKYNETIPHFVRSALTHTALLFLGFRLDEWVRDFQVLFRSLLSQEGRNLRKKFSHVMQIDPEEGQMSDREGARRSLSSYLQDARISVYWGSAETFARELKKRGNLNARSQEAIGGPAPVTATVRSGLNPYVGRRRLYERGVGNEELQAEMRDREAQLIEQAWQLEKQEAQLRQQRIRLRELAEFDRQSNIVGGVFISYSHDDMDIVDALTRRLDADKINYWRDEKDLFVGEVVDKAISKAIQDSRLFLIVLTPKSISSKWVDRELDEAAHEETEGRKIILPVVKNLSPEQIPARLRRKLYVDMSKSFDDGYAKLAKSIRHHLHTQVLKSSSAH